MINNELLFAGPISLDLLVLPSTQATDVSLLEVTLDGIKYCKQCFQQVEQYIIDSVLHTLIMS